MRWCCDDGRCGNVPKPKDGDDPYLRKSCRRDCHCTFSDDSDDGGGGGGGSGAAQVSKLQSGSLPAWIADRLESCVRTAVGRAHGEHCRCYDQVGTMKEVEFCLGVWAESFPLAADSDIDSSGFDVVSSAAAITDDAGAGGDGGTDKGKGKGPRARA